MKVSVVIPVWNRASTLARAIESAHVQSPDELIVVDDASTDGSAEIAESLGVRVIRHPAKSRDWIEALGPVYRELDADYVIGMGADDVLHEGFLSALREVTDPQTARGWPGVVFGDYALLREADPPEVLGVRRFGFPGVLSMKPDEAHAWFRASPLTRHECGVGSAIRRDLLLWLYDEEYWRLGPWSDSFGYVLAAIRGGCTYVPKVFAGFCVQQETPSYHQQAINDDEKRKYYLEVAKQWLSRPGIVPYAAGVQFGI